MCSSDLPQASLDTVAEPSVPCAPKAQANHCCNWHCRRLVGAREVAEDGEAQVGCLYLDAVQGSQGSLSEVQMLMEPPTEQDSGVFDEPHLQELADFELSDFSPAPGLLGQAAGGPS